MKSLRIFLIAFASLCFVAGAQAEGVKWTDNFETAKTQAKERDKLVFALFTGSDWCPGCIFLESSILNDKTVQAFINEKFVPFIADFPRERKIQPGVARQNAKLFESYELEGYPTLLLIDKDGKKLVQSYNESETPADFIKQLKGMLEKTKK